MRRLRDTGRNRLAKEFLAQHARAALEEHDQTTYVITCDAPVAPSGRKFILWDSFRAGDLLKEDGWQPAFPETVFVPGDLLLRPEVVMPKTTSGRPT